MSWITWANKLLGRWFGPPAIAALWLGGLACLTLGMLAALGFLVLLFCVVIPGAASLWALGTLALPVLLYFALPRLRFPVPEQAALAALYTRLLWLTGVLGVVAGVVFGFNLVVLSANPQIAIRNLVLFGLLPLAVCLAALGGRHSLVRRTGKEGDS